LTDISLYDFSIMFFLIIQEDGLIFIEFNRPHMILLQQYQIKFHMIFIF